MNHVILTALVAYLKGDALALLLDLLDESGADAQSARIRSLLTQNADRIEVVSSVLPAESCWVLACDFTAHVLPIWEVSAPEDRRPHSILQRRQRLQSAASSEELDALHTAALRLLGEVAANHPLAMIAAGVYACVSIIRTPQASLWAAAQYARYAVRASHPWQSYSDAEVKAAIARETAWQEAHLAAHLEGLLSPALTSA